MTIENLKPSHKGSWVEYVPHDGSKPELGRIKSWNDCFIHVVYHCDGDWDHFERFEGVSTNPEDLRFVLDISKGTG